MKKLLYAYIFITVIFTAITSLAIDQKTYQKKLYIYASNAFARKWEDDTFYKKLFEEKCNCELVILSIDNSNAILSRLIIEGDSSKADLVVGIDSNLISKAEDSGLFVPYKQKKYNLALPIKWDNKYFIPYDYSYLSFMYNSKILKNPPKSFKELVYSDEDYKIVIQDPRTSPIGLSLVAWSQMVLKNDFHEAWKKLFKKVVTVTKNWNDSYFLFLKGEADMILTYKTSVQYHQIIEKNFDYKTINFSEGEYLILDVMGKLKNSKNQELADKFIDFILSEEFQKFIAKHNFMYPVIDIGNALPIEYNGVSKPRVVLYQQPSTFKLYKNLWIQEWLDALIEN